MKAKVKPHKLLSLLLALVMVVGMLPMGQVAYAASAVSNLTWDGNTAKWDSDGSASQYRVVLRTYPGDTVISNKVVDVTSIDYSSYLLPGNTYYFRVAPFVGSEQQSFVNGPNKTIDGSRGTISPITIDSAKKTATWTSVTGADGYDVWVLRNGAQIGFVRQTTDTSFDFSSDYKDTGNGEYSIYVRAYKMSRGNYLAEGESSKVTLNELPDTVTIHFDSNGGTGTMGDVTVAYASNYTLPECSFTPPANMEFAIWEIPGGQITAGSSTKFFENTTVKALWKAKTYTVTFVPGEGSGTSFIRKVNAGEKLSLPSCSFTAPENKVFDKWDMGEPNDKIDVSSDMTVTALWKDAETYTVTVNNDGNGTAFASPTSGPDGTVVTLTATPNPGYKFKEWTRQAGMLSGGTSIPNATSATTTFTISGYNVVVTATFEAESPTTKTLDSIAITTPPTKTEYTEGDSFDPTGMVVEATYSDGSSAPVTGYTVSPIGALTISDTIVTVTYTEDGVTKTTTQNIKVDAASVPTDYTVTVNVNNAEYGTASASPTSGPDGTVVTLTATPNPGYKFKEWTRQAGMLSGGTSIPNATSATTTFTISGYNVVVTAIFEADGTIPLPEYDITVTDGKATVGAGTEISKAAEGTTVTLTANAAPTDKVFDKWEVVSGSITLADATSETTTFTMPAGAVSVKATYKDKPVTTYTVSFDANGGTGSMADATGVSGDYVLPVCGFTAPNGKQFKAWSVGGVEKAAGDTITVNANTTVFAVWETIPVTYYTVTFDSNGGSAVTAQSIEAGQKATKPADPTKDGYDFKGWTLNGSAYDFNTAVNGNITLVAIWEQQQVVPTTYTVSFAANGGTGTMADVTGISGEYTLPENGFTAPDGKQFKAWSVGGVEKAVGDKITVTADTTVTAVWEDIPAGHTCDIKPVAKVEPSCTEGGKEAYYKCEGCGKFYEDALGTKEITDLASWGNLAKLGHTESDWKSDKDNHWKECTVAGCGVIIENSKAAHADANNDGKCDTCEYNVGIPTTPGGDKPNDNPQTGDNSMMWLWIALLFVSGFGVVTTTVYTKKRKSVK